MSSSFSHFIHYWDTHKTIKSLFFHFLSVKVVYKNNDVRLELSSLAKQGDPKMKVFTFNYIKQCIILLHTEHVHFFVS